MQMNFFPLLVLLSFPIFRASIITAEAEYENLVSRGLSVPATKVSAMKKKLTLRTDLVDPSPNATSD
jgi:hypothetical protein